MSWQEVDYDALIPNNVGLSQDPKLQRALETWHPGYIDWWMSMGPDGFQMADVYLRTAISVEKEGWAKFGYVRMPDYRWGILLAPEEPDRRIPFGEHAGEPVWQEICANARVSGLPGCATVVCPEHAYCRCTHPHALSVVRVHHDAVQAKSTKSRLPLITGRVIAKGLQLVPSDAPVFALEQR